MKLDIGKDEFAEVLLPCQEFQGWTLDDYYFGLLFLWPPQKTINIFLKYIIF